MPPQFLFFDLGNVLLRFCNDRRCRQVAEVAGVTPEEVRRALFDEQEGAAALVRFERGELDEAGIFAHFCRTVGAAPDAELLWAACGDIFTPIDESVALVQRLAAAGNRLGVLSNTNPRDWGFVSQKYPFVAASFEFAILSHEVGSMKPEPGIFAAAVRRAGTTADCVFFVDDMPENVAGALAAGLDAVQFTTAAALTAELVRRGVPGAAAPPAAVR